jgi:hypothetical protein
MYLCTLPNVFMCKYIYVLYKKAAFACMWIIMGDVIFVHFIDLDDVITFLHSQSHFVQNQRTYQGPFGERLVRAFRLCSARWRMSYVSRITACYYSRKVMPDDRVCWKVKWNIFLSVHHFRKLKLQ